MLSLLVFPLQIDSTFCLLTKSVELSPCSRPDFRVSWDQWICKFRVSSVPSQGQVELLIFLLSDMVTINHSGAGDLWDFSSHSWLAFWPSFINISLLLFDLIFKIYASKFISDHSWFSFSSKYWSTESTLPLLSIFLFLNEDFYHYLSYL